MILHTLFSNNLESRKCITRVKMAIKWLLKKQSGYHVRQSTDSKIDLEFLITEQKIHYDPAVF